MTFIVKVMGFEDSFQRFSFISEKKNKNFHFNVLNKINMRSLSFWGKTELLLNIL